MIKNTLWEKAGLPYQVWALHGRWNFKEVSSLIESPSRGRDHFVNGHINDDTVYITILREPLSQFKSLWNFYELSRRFKRTLNNYILFGPNKRHMAKNPTNLRTRRHKGHLGLNQMLFDFGFHVEDPQNRETIEHKIKEIDETFDLVLMQEKFDESLILMKERLCWGYQDITYSSRNQRKYSKSVVLSERAEQKLRSLLAPDQALYSHFRKKFDVMIDSDSNITAKVDLFRKINKRHCERGVRDIRRDREDPMCPYYKLNEFPLIRVLRSKLIEKARTKLRLGH